jgi:predicted lipoprotein with Yx(FWY)xxD motif
VSRSTYAFALLVVAALAIAGCGSSSGSSSSSGGAYGGNSGSSSTASSETTESSGGAYAPPSGGKEEKAMAEGGEAANVSLASVGKLGMVLVDSKGFTLYDFHKDKGGKSACYGACAEAWPPLMTSGAPTPGNGANGAMLGTVKRTDGTMQVTYNGHPLYTFVGDKKPGEGTGNDVKAFGGQWYALMGSGEETPG